MTPAEETKLRLFWESLEPYQVLFPMLNPLKPEGGDEDLHRVGALPYILLNAEEYGHAPVGTRQRWMQGVVAALRECPDVYKRTLDLHDRRMGAGYWN